MRHHIAFLLALACTALSQNTNKNCPLPGIRRGLSPRKFVVCVEKDGKLQSVENECSKGLTFDVVRKTCSRAFPRATILQQVSSANWSATTQDYYYDGINATTGYPDAQTRSETPATVPPPITRPCKGSGAYCSNCNTLSFCVSYELPTGEKLLKGILDLPCDADSVCVTQQGCVKTLNGGLCKEGSFACGDVGLYPDLYDCKTFHSCTIGHRGQLIDTPFTCTEGLLGNRWNPLTSTCGWSESDDSCRRSPVPLCTKPLEMRSVGGQIYSICIVDEITHTLTPRLFRCPQDFVFNAQNYACESPV